MGDVVYLDGRNKMIATAEQMLKQAQDGDLLALGFVTCRRDGSVGTAFYVTPMRSVVWHLAGGIQELNYRLLREGVQQDPDEEPGDDDPTG